jgi:serine/threonine protein kinase
MSSHIIRISMRLAPGSVVGSCEIVAPIGAGGMGEVYRARDTRLHCNVAIKILPDAFARDPERLARFEREARTLAALNHPHVAQVFGVVDLPGEGSGRALVLEFVDGEDHGLRSVDLIRRDVSRRNGQARDPVAGCRLSALAP